MTKSESHEMESMADDEEKDTQRNKNQNIIKLMLNKNGLY